MEHNRHFGALTATFAALFTASVALAAPPSYNESVETAMKIHHAAVRQSEAAAGVVRTGKYDLETSDKAYETAYRNAAWEGIKLANPKSTSEQRKRMANLISAAKMLADASNGAALADYISANQEIDGSAQYRIERDADDAFRLGYEQAIRRADKLPSL